MRELPRHTPVTLTIAVEGRHGGKRSAVQQTAFLILGAATLGKLFLDQSAALSPWPVLLVAGAYLLARDVRTTGWYSIGGITSAFALLAFWLKWMFDTEPSFGLRKLSYDNDAAVVVAGVFVLSMGLGYAVLRGTSPAAGRSEAPESSESSLATGDLTPNVTSWLLLLGGVLVLARLGLAMAFSIGVPGVLPTDPGVIRPLTSAVYYLSLTAPLAFTAVLAVHGPPRWGWGSALVLGSAYAIVGATIGYRSYPVLAFVTLVFAWLLSRSRPGRPGGAGGGSALALGVAAIGAVVSLRLALSNRALGRVGATDQGIAEFLSGRVGGLDYLSPVVQAVQRQGSSLEMLSPGRWDLFMRVDVYGLPPGAVTGFAATLPGWLYGIAALYAVSVGGFLAGLGARRVDRWCHQIQGGAKPARGTALTVGAALCWLNFLAEGTLRASALQAGAYLVAAVIVAFLLGGETRAVARHPLSGRVPGHVYGGPRAGSGPEPTADR